MTLTGNHNIVIDFIKNIDFITHLLSTSEIHKWVERKTLPNNRTLIKINSPNKREL